MLAVVACLKRVAAVDDNLRRPVLGDGRDALRRVRPVRVSGTLCSAAASPRKPDSRWDDAHRGAKGTSTNGACIALFRNLSCTRQYAERPIRCARSPSTTPAAQPVRWRLQSPFPQEPPVTPAADPATAPEAIRSRVRAAVEAAWQAAVSAGSLPPVDDPAAAPVVEVERPANAAFGDEATNLAMKLARPLRRSPLDIAEQLAAAIGASD